MLKKGYTKISHAIENAAQSVELLKVEGCALIYTDKINERTTEKPELQRMLQELQKDDVVIVQDLDQLTCSIVELLQLIEVIKSKNASLKSLNDTWLDITKGNPLAGCLSTIFSELAEYERKMIKQRFKENVEEMKKARIYLRGGWKYTHKYAGMNHAIELFKEGKKTVKEICDVTKVSRSALYRELQKREIPRARKTN